MTTLEHVRALRANLPKGKKDPWGVSSKRVLLQRALKKDDIVNMTDGELSVFNEFLDYIVEVKKTNKEYEKKAIKIAQMAQQ